MPPEPLKPTNAWPAKAFASFKNALPFAILFLVVFVAALAANAVSGTLALGGNSGTADEDSNSSSASAFDSSCNVIGIEIRDCITSYKPDNAGSGSDFFSTDGCIAYTSSEEVVSVIESAMSEKGIKALLLEIDSTGGESFAAEEIENALKAFGKPSIAWIRGYGDSAAYWIASAAKLIIAGENSDVGSIGVTSSYVDNVKKNASEGLTYNRLIAGKFKDYGSPDKSLTQEEQALIQRDLDIVYENFIRTVATNRHLAIDKVRALADGSSMLGSMALEKGLIDKVGTKQAVWKALEDEIGEKPEVCW